MTEPRLRRSWKVVLSDGSVYFPDTKKRVATVVRHGYPLEDGEVLQVVEIREIMARVTGKYGDPNYKYEQLWSKKIPVDSFR